MTFRPGDAAVLHFLLQAENKLAVFGMDSADGAELSGSAEAVHQDLVVGHDGAFVGHEMLETVDALLVHQRAHVAVHALVPPGDGDVEGIIGRRLFRPAAPLLVGFQQGFLGIGDDKVDDHRRTAGRTSTGAGIEILARHRAHERQFHLGVGIDAARHYQ